MESIFPGVLFLGFAAKVILQAAIAVLFLYDAKKTWANKEYRLFSVSAAILGVLVGVGFLTQLAVLGAGILAVILTMRPQSESVFRNKMVVFLTVAILLFLFLAGPSGLAFDLPY